MGYERPALVLFCSVLSPSLNVFRYPASCLLNPLVTEVFRSFYHVLRVCTVATANPAT